MTVLMRAIIGLAAAASVLFVPAASSELGWFEEGGAVTVLNKKEIYEQVQCKNNQDAAGGVEENKGRQGRRDWVRFRTMEASWKVGEACEAWRRRATAPRPARRGISLTCHEFSSWI